MKDCGVCGSICSVFQLSGLGKIESHTTIRSAPPGFKAPYVVGIIRLKEGINIVAGVVGGDVVVGDSVQVVFRRLNESTEHEIIRYGYKFRKINPAP